MPKDLRNADTDPVWRLPEELGALRPEAVSRLEDANRAAWQAVQPALLELVRLRIAALIGNEAGLQRRSQTAREQGLDEATIAQVANHCSPEFSQHAKDCLAFAEQFVLDVSGLGEAALAALSSHLNEEQLHAFVVALYVTECTQRLEMMSPLLLSGPSASPGPTPSADRSLGTPRGRDDAVQQLHQTLKDYQATVVRGVALDPVTTELVRLRCARTHNCRICQTLRLTDARAAGVDDELTAKVDFYERSDLDERTKTALRITDAFITLPGTLGQEVIEYARSVFSEEQLAELLLDITKWSTQKIHVALGTDAADALPTNEDGVSFFAFADDGRVAGFSATPAMQAQTGSHSS